jgi:hypothetical protein
MAPSTQRLFLKAWLLLHSYQILMPILGVKITKTMLLKLPFAQPQPGTDEDIIQDHLAALYFSTRYSLIEPKCLARSLTLWQLLQYQNLDASVKIGVSKENRAFKAHAWVEFQGQILNDTPAYVQSYAQISSLI